MGNRYEKTYFIHKNSLSGPNSRLVAANCSEPKSFPQSCPSLWRNFRFPRPLRFSRENQSSRVGATLGRPPMPNGIGNAHTKSEGPSKNHHVIARSRQATWQSRRFSGVFHVPRDCHGPTGLAMTWLWEAGPPFFPLDHRNGSAILRIARASAARPYGQKRQNSHDRRGGCQRHRIFPGNGKKLHRPVVGLWSLSMLTCF